VDVRGPRTAAFVVLSAVSGCGSKPPAERPPVSVIVAEAPPEPASEPELVADTPPQAVATDDPWRGTWEGEGVQSDGQRWRMVVQLRGSDGVCGTVEYPTIPCAAEWHCTGRDASGNVEAVERLTSGQSLCVDGGSMTMRVTDSGQLDWSWQGSGIMASAVLDRVR